MTNMDVARAVRVLRRGGVIAFPTETTYGLGCDPRNATAVRKIFEMKGRSEKKPLQLIAGSIAQVFRIADFSPEEKKLAKKYWPGALTLLVHLKSGKKLVSIVSPRRVIGIRVTSSKIAKAIAMRFGYPIAATSANRSGSKPAFSGIGVRRAFHHFQNKPDFILDAGQIPRNKPTTVARVRRDGKIEILRQGATHPLPPLLKQERGND